MSLVALVLVLVVGGAAAYLALLNHTATSNIKHEALLPPPANDPKPPAGIPAPADAENILLIGSDAKPPRPRPAPTSSC